MSKTKLELEPEIHSKIFETLRRLKYPILELILSGKVGQSLAGSWAEHV